MKYSLQAIWAALLVLWFSGIVVAEGIGDPRTYTGPVENRKLICMSMGNALQAREGIEEHSQGKNYYLCFAGCVAQFRNDPVTFRFAEDPVSHVKVDKAQAPVYAYQGRAYFFESEKTRQAFAKEPFRYVLGEKEGDPGPRTVSRFSRSIAIGGIPHLSGKGASGTTGGDRWGGRMTELHLSRQIWNCGWPNRNSSKIFLGMSADGPVG